MGSRHGTLFLGSTAWVSGDVMSWSMSEKESLSTSSLFMLNLVVGIARTGLVGRNENSKSLE